MLRTPVYLEMCIHTIADGKFQRRDLLMKMNRNKPLKY